MLQKGSRSLLDFLASEAEALFRSSRSPSGMAFHRLAGQFNDGMVQALARSHFLIKQLESETQSGGLLRLFIGQDLSRFCLRVEWLIHAKRQYMMVCICQAATSTTLHATIMYHMTSDPSRGGKQQQGPDLVAGAQRPP